jgi:hypothetical protein
LHANAATNGNGWLLFAFAITVESMAASFTVVSFATTSELAAGFTGSGFGVIITEDESSKRLSCTLLVASILPVSVGLLLMVVF